MTNSNPPRRYGGHGSFQDRLADGRRAEHAVAEWLTQRGHRVTHLANLPSRDGVGPRLSTHAAGAIIAPDLLAARNGRGRLIECKAKSGWTLHRATGSWSTGISAGEAQAYVDAAMGAGLPLYLIFVMRPVSDRPEPKMPSPPGGLFAASVTRLMARVHHRWGRGEAERLFWTPAQLCHLAAWREIEPLLLSAKTQADAS